MSTDSTNPLMRFFYHPKVAVLSGILGLLISFAGIGIAIFLSSSWFNWFDHALSDLGHPFMLGGSSGTPGLNVAAPIFNGALIIAGLVTILFTLYMLLHQRVQNSKLGIVAGILLLIACFFLVAIGIFHEVFSGIHYAASVGFFVFVLLAGITFGLRFMQIPKLRILGVIGLILGLISAGIWIADLLFPVLPWTGPAIPEIISAITALIWILPTCLLIAFEKF